jgi:hypothetical protein
VLKDCSFVSLIRGPVFAGSSIGIADWDPAFYRFGTLNSFVPLAAEPLRVKDSYAYTADVIDAVTVVECRCDGV